MVIQRVIAGFRLHAAPHPDGIGENAPKCRGPPLLGVLGFAIHFYVELAAPNYCSHPSFIVLFFLGGGGGYRDTSHHEGNVISIAQGNSNAM